MRFAFLSEAETSPGTTHRQRYVELVDQILLAEKVGFEVFGTSEQHFAIGGIASAAPETLYPYAMALTSRIRFLHAVTLLPKNFNHPLRVAERVATEDILSNGRVELGTGRGNTTLALRAFEVGVTENKSQWSEGLDLIRAAFLNDPFHFEGEHYKVPPRSLTPKPVQWPHPPLSVAATSPGTHVQAAQKGIGVMTSSSFMGFEYMKNTLALYDETYDGLTFDFPTTRSKAAVNFGAVICLETMEEAMKYVGPAIEYSKQAIGAYERLAKLSEDYAYMGAVSGVDFHDTNFMLNESAGFVVGDPDECIRQVQKFADLGIDTLIMRIDSMPHDVIMRTIANIGKYVIPHFSTPWALAKSADDALEEIRALRPVHEEKLREFEASRGKVHG
ncbi:LLM class flavin-dependent oxidoreductase [Arthrobacter sulfonylureivorans]|uniref:LLM class flavin-dependent oxidoreductase n=1 Tax=Arthrobacter sulfonylureivorans TaxID=2486855 RepID=A0ABY3WBZ1_9MICC|nr:LLM class flavin-dependent oxidoreductase [Arthrobacter sulfonylureivorans]UNK47874.1 LLM class flavin-dependent oxidoreductase [Arthrobacter sulfonylureivorans]